MSISMYRLTVPMFQRGLASLKTYLDKAEAYAKEKNIDPAILAAARLAPDMAMAAQLRWLKAEEYLEMGYTAADAFEKKRGEKYIRKQLEDRKAKFLTARAAAGGRVSVELFRDMKEAVEIVGRLMRDSELTHHPYETLLQIVKVVDARGTTIPTDLIRILTGQLKEIIGRAKGRVGVVPEGYQRIHAEGWIRETETLAAAFI